MYIHTNYIYRACIVICIHTHTCIPLSVCMYIYIYAYLHVHMHMTGNNPWQAEDAKMEKD